MEQKIVVSGTLIIDGKVLLIRRSEAEKFLPGVYEMPGGKVDFGQTAEDALMREFIEEVNLRIIPKRIYRTISYESKHKGVNRHTIELEYIVALEDGENLESLRLSNDHDDWKLMSLQEAKGIGAVTKEKLNSLELAFGSEL